MKVVLTVYIVSCGLTLIQSKDRTGEKAVTSEVNDGSKIQENFRHFFDSMRKNDMKNTKTYKSILAEEAAKEEEVFNLMKGALQFTRQKNANEHQRHFGNDIVIFKRETSESDNNTASPFNQSKSTSEWNEFIDQFKRMADSGERIYALEKFVLRQQTEKERVINEIKVAKEAEKKQAVEAMKTKLALGTLPCAFSYMGAGIEHVYRSEVEKCNTTNWIRERPSNISVDEEMNSKIDVFYHKWLEYLFEKQNESEVWKAIRSRVPEDQLVEFSWNVPKAYLFCRKNIYGKRLLSLEQYKSLKASGIKKPLTQFLREHSQWILSKTDVDYVNIVLETVGLDPVGYEWLDQQAGLVIPYVSQEKCWPSDKYYYVRRSFEHVIESSSGATKAV